MNTSPAFGTVAQRGATRQLAAGAVHAPDSSVAQRGQRGAVSAGARLTAALRGAASAAPATDSSGALRGKRGALLRQRDDARRAQRPPPAAA